MFIYRLNDGTKQSTEGAGYRLEFFVERIIQQFLINVPHQVDMTFLLQTLYGIVGGVKVGYKNAMKVLEQLSQKVAFSGLPEDIHDFFQVRENPDVALSRSQCHFRLIDMKKVPGEDLLE
jgi:hypothetical protein